MRTALLLLNLVASLASAAWGVVALIRPGYLSGASNAERGKSLFVRMYAARSIPFGLAAGFLPFWFAGKAVAWVLFTAAAIQVADILIGAGRKERGMIVGASIGATVHILCGLTIY